MGLFSKKKTVEDSKYMITPNELLYLIDLAVQAIDQYQIEYEVEFKMGNKEHVIGIDYDRTNAPKKGYDPQYMSFYLDGDGYRTLQTLAVNATIDGRSLTQIGQEIEVDKVYKEPIETGDIERHDIFLGYNI